MNSLFQIPERHRPPTASVRPHTLQHLGHVRTDPYFWLRDRENPEVISYLNEENAHTEKVLLPVADLKNVLFEEMKSRIKEEDCTVPVKMEEYFYYTRVEIGKEYPIFCRKHGSVESPEEVILDANRLSEGHSFFNLGEMAVTLDQKILAFSTDVVGRRVHTIYFKDLTTGLILDERIEEVTGNLTWAADHQTLFYSKQNLETLRSDRAYRHTLGSTTSDVLVYEELDDTFQVEVQRTTADRFITIVSSSTMTNEVRFLDAREPNGSFSLFHPRERGHEYSLDEAGDRFLILTNDRAKNFKLMEASLENHSKSDWKVVVPHREDTLLETFLPFNTHLVLQERRKGLTQIQVIDRSTGVMTSLQFPDSAYLAQIGGNREFDSQWVRYVYESLTRPPSVYEYNFRTGETVLRKQKEVPGYLPEMYESDRLFAQVSDGAEIPISIVSKKGLAKNPNSPCLIYGYGSYGLSMDPDFSSVWLSLVDRGFRVAIAHIRGGSEMGRHWYEDGRLLKKKNTFSDFIACTEYLIAQGLTSPAHLYAMGGSAGGLLMGAVMNARPDLYHGVVAAVPFVDVMTTMLDESIPLTTGEYDEWGNPNEKNYYEYMLSYSPYDNLKAQVYPNLLVTTGLHDSQVQYWEPAKWVAKLRTLNQGPNVILLHTEMEAGHGGKMGRFARLHEEARVYSFLLGLEGTVK